MDRKLKTSLIIPVKNEGENVRNTIDSFQEAERIPDQIIVVDDNSEDNCCDFLSLSKYKDVKCIRTGGLGAAGARNFGASYAEGDLLIFSDAHIFVEKDWLLKVEKDFKRNGDLHVLVPGIAPVEDPKNVGYGQTWKEDLSINWFVRRPKGLAQIPLAPGGFLMVRREVFETIGGFDRGFKVWGKEDEEFSVKTWLFGFNIFVEPAVKVLHVFRKRHPYLVALEYVHYNYLRMAISHFNQQRISKIIAVLKPYDYAEKLIAEMFLSDVWLQRKEYLKLRKYDDDWFMKRFKINF